VPRRAWSGPTSRQQEAALRRLDTIRAASDKLLAQQTTLEARREAAIRAAITAGLPTRVIGEQLGITPGRVSQMVTRPTPAEPEPEIPATAPARRKGRAVREVPRLPEEGTALVSAVATVRKLAHYGRRVTAWVDLPAQRGVTDDGQVFAWPGRPVLRDMLHLLPENVTRVYVTGGLDVFTDRTASAELVRAAFTSVADDTWQVARSGLYLADGTLPVGRWTHAVQGRTVEVHRAATWLGEEPCTPEEARACMAALSELLRERFGTGQWLSTPATTGRDLWRRTIPEGRAYPVLAPELRELIHATAGQGRAELLPAPAEQVPGFVYLDGRFMYAALTWGMPVVTDDEPPRRWTAAQVAGLDDGQRARLFAGRGRWLVDVTVPAGWSHVGLLPTMADDRRAGWRYPREAGERFRTWVDGAELLVALGQGWPCEVVEGFTMREGKPLNLWTDKLVDAWHAAAQLECGDQVRGALRAMLLFSLGAFAARSHTVTRYGTAEDAREAEDAGRMVKAPTLVGDRLTWQETTPGNEWTDTMAHPEWSATVWARARVRLLDHALPGGGRGGALHLPAGSVLAFRTDALYTTSDPRWPDDGKPGRFRVKGSLPGPVKAPTDLAELFQLRTDAEATT
jgi:hypothetical protein